MAEEEGPTTDWPETVPKPVQEFPEEWENLPRKTTEELKRVLFGITCLPYNDEKVQASLFEKVKQLQPFHIIQIFDLGVLPLQRTLKDSSKFLEEVHKLFDYCLRFCYNPDESQRVFFEFYSKILHFCFPSDSEQALQVEACRELLKLVQQLQVGKIGEFLGLDQATQSLKIYGTLPLFDELLSLFQHRRREQMIVDIISQTAEVVSLDAKASNFSGFQINQVVLTCKQVVLPVILRNWMQLLKFTTVSNGFIVRMFKTDSLSWRKSPTPRLIPGIQTDPVYNYEGLLFVVVEALQEMEGRGEKIELPNDQERLQIFFSLITDFDPNSRLTMTMLKLLACTSISNKVLREVVELFAPKEERSHDIFQENACIIAAFDIVSKILILLPEGKLVMKVLGFCKDTFRNLQVRAQALSSLLRIILQRIETLDKGVCVKKESERVAKFLKTLSPNLLLLGPAFESVVSMLIQIFPCSFETLKDVLDVIKVWTFGADHAEKSLKIVLQCLVRLVQQSWSENVKKNIVCLFLQHPDLQILPLIESLCLCQQLSLEWIDDFLVRLSNFFKDVGETEKNTIACFVLRLVASDQRIEHKREIMSAFLETLNFCWDEKIQTFASDTLPIIALIERLSLSRSRVVKVLELSKDRLRGLPCARQVLQLINVSQGVLNERRDEYFDFLLAAMFNTLRTDKNLCDSFYATLSLCGLSLSVGTSSNCDLLFVCVALVAGLLSVGLFKKEIDLRCLQILMHAKGLVLPYEQLQFYFKTRSAVFKVLRLLRDRNICFTADCLPPEGEIFLSSLTFVARSDVSSSLVRVLLTGKVCNMVLSNPALLMYNMLAVALANLLPYTDRGSPQHGDIGRCAVLSLSHFEVVLEQPAVLEQLGRIPANAKKSVVKILSSKTPRAFSADEIVQVFSFMASFKDVHQSFFFHFLSLFEVITKNSASGRDVIDYLEEIKNAIVTNHIRSELIPLAVLTFAHLVDGNVEKEQREVFVMELAAQWTSVTISSDICSFLELPNLLWQAYKRAHSEKGQTIAFIHKIFQNDTEMITSLLRDRSLMVQMLPDSLIRRKILCRDLEWLVLHSSLSRANVALAFRFCLLSSSMPFRCFSFFEVLIEESKIKLVPHQRADEKETQSCVTNAAGNQGATVQEHETSTLTPGLIGYKIVKHLQRLQGDECNLPDSTEKIWNVLLRAGGSCIDRDCRTYFIDDYAKVFLSILEHASSVEVVSHWGTLNCHHVMQCLEVIIKTCEWRNSGELVHKQAYLELHVAVRTALEELRKKPIASFSPLFPLPVPVPCFRLLNQAIKEFIVILEKRLPLQQTQGLLKLARINPQAAGSTAEIISNWSSREEADELLKTVQKRIEEETHDNGDFLWQLLRECRHICTNSSQMILDQLDELVTRMDVYDEYGLNRLPIWRESMTNEGFSARAVNSWCVSFFLTPSKDLTSRDVDAIVDLNPTSLKLVPSVSDNIRRCIFPEGGFQVTRGKGIKEDHVMVRLRRARILGEFINVLRLLKPETSKKDDVVRQIVLDACDKLCQSHDDESSCKRITRTFYKIHSQALKSLFTEVFGKKRLLEAVVDLGGDTGAENVERRVARQTSYLHENLPQVLEHGQVYEPMLVLLRRWMTSIVSKPALASHVREIVQLLFSRHSTEKVTLSRELHDSIQKHVLSLERNQALIAQLQAAGYNVNQRGQSYSFDLWTSPSIEFPCYLSRGESPDEKRWTKKLTKALRPLWSEWKVILFSRGILKIKVGETDVNTRDLFAPNVSLSEMESQVAAIKELTKHDLLPDLYMAQLIRREQQLRSRIEKLRVTDDKDTKTSAREKVELKKFVAVWENRFLENVGLCSNRIPGCYAPNGFHSEKPALCALSVDNRILTVFKEEKGGRREEMENVEVKLFDAGMYVYGLHSSGHDYVTDELWAAFFKMLLEKGLVPRIVLNNESPGFDWIKNINVVKPTSSLPCPWKWQMHCGIVPPEEDYFDYYPFTALVFPSLHELSEFITLTKENVAGFQFSDLKDFESTERKVQQAREMRGKAIKHLKGEVNALPIQAEGGLGLKEILVKRLTNAVKRTVQQLVEGEEPSLKSVMTEIDKNKLSSGYPQILQIVSCPNVYANMVIAACKKAQGEVAQSTFRA